MADESEKTVENFEQAQENAAPQLDGANQSVASETGSETEESDREAAGPSSAEITCDKRASNAAAQRDQSKFSPAAPQAVEGNAAHGAAATAADDSVPAVQEHGTGSALNAHAGRTAHG